MLQSRLDLAAPTAAAAAAPLDDAERLAALRLARTRTVGPATFRRLSARFADFAAAVEALPDFARRGGAPVEPFDADLAAAEMEAAAALGARLLVLGRPGYPARLAEASDAPPILWALGDPAAPAGPAVAIVGGRNASALGLRLSAALAEGLAAAGRVVVSGLARGVDGAAHEGALAAGRPAATVAVLAGGLDRVTPSQHAALAARIVDSGALLSEAPPGLEPQARHFPRRNRIISGLSDGVVVIEASTRSGTLITADRAAEQGREVMATPGHPFDPRSAGGNALIRDGAALIRTVDDVLEALAGPCRGALSAPDGLAEDAAAILRPAAPADDALRAAVAGRLADGPLHEEALLRVLGAPASAVAEALLELELAGRVERRSGGRLTLRPAPAGADAPAA